MEVVNLVLTFAEAKDFLHLPVFCNGADTGSFHDIRRDHQQLD